MIVVRRKRRRLILNRAPLCGTEPHVRRPRMLSRMRLRVSHKKMYHHRQRRASSRPSGDPSGDPFVFSSFSAAGLDFTPGLDPRLAIAVDDASPLLARFGFSGGTRLSVRALRRARACRRARRLSRSPSADPP